MDCLVVDADAVSRRLAGLLLKRLGYPSPGLVASALEVPSSPAGLTLVSTDGNAEGVAALKARLAPGARLLAVLASASDEARQACLRAGADAVLVKPLALQDLAAVLSPPAEASDFNAGTWAELRQMFGADGAAKLAGALIDDLPVQQQRMSDAIGNRDLPALKRVAHALRGVSLQMGAEALARLCTETEAAAAAGQADAATELGARLIRRHAALVERMRDETARH